MSESPKPERLPGAPRRGSAVASSALGGSSAARRQACAILEVLAGARRPLEAAQALQTSLPRYYQLERRALLGLLAACEPAPRGPRLDPTRKLAALERENQRLRRECDRQQALVRLTQRSLGLVLPAPKATPAKGTEPPAKENGAKRHRRPRRPSVRALKMARTLEGAPEAEGAAVALPPASVPVAESVKK